MDFDNFVNKLNLLSHYYEESEGTILDRLLNQEIERIRPLLEKKNSGSAMVNIPAFSSAANNSSEAKLYAPTAKRPGSRQYYIASTAELSGSKPIRAIFGENNDWEITSWKELFHDFLEMLVKDGYCPADNILKAAGNLSVNMQKGMKSGKGYDYNDELDISIQASAAPVNAEVIKKLCAKYDIPFRIIVRWNGNNAPEGVENGYFSSEK